MMRRARYRKQKREGFKRLSDISSGESVKILRVNARDKLLYKLLDMGFIDGTVINVIREAPLFDPMELRVQNYLVSLRKSEAQLIEVERV